MNDNKLSNSIQNSNTSALRSCAIYCSRVVKINPFRDKFVSTSVQIFYIRLWYVTQTVQNRQHAVRIPCRVLAAFDRSRNEQTIWTDSFQRLVLIDDVNVFLVLDRLLSYVTTGFRKERQDGGTPWKIENGNPSVARDTRWLTSTKSINI